MSTPAPPTGSGSGSDAGPGRRSYSSFDSPPGRTSADPDRAARKYRAGGSPDEHRALLSSPSPSSTSAGAADIGPARLGLGARLGDVWQKHSPVLLVLTATVFAQLMATMVRILETDTGGRIHPLHILFGRQSVTAALSVGYMRWARTPDAPWGAPAVRTLLLARGFGGFWGIFGLYYSLQYLPIADATVITFLAPVLTSSLCAALLGQPFGPVERAAAAVSLVGVALIARPAFLADLLRRVLAGHGGADPASTGATPAQRATAVGIAFVGAMGASCAYTTMRWIGPRAHPLISVTYFSVACTMVSGLGMVLIPSVGIEIPHGQREWLLMVGLGVTGFFMQFLLSSGLQREQSSRATTMLYVQMIFALALDKIVFGINPSLLSCIGGTLIIGSAACVVMAGAKPVDGGSALGRKAAEPVLEDGDFDRITQRDGTTGSSDASMPRRNA